jgi:hypothetical protein
MRVMRFRRGPAVAHELTVPPVVAAAPTPDDGSIPLVDSFGQGFELLRAIDVGHSLWRVSGAADLQLLASGQILVVTAYSTEDIEASRPLMQRFMTIILAMGLGPRFGSRALALGAVGYVDASTHEGDIRGMFGDALARVRIRRLRKAPA